ncbi:hypothetical protein MMC11_002520 [Xylographa trunciseda]|nr:hypothetical protein [Xylographa trunciseda]
MAIQSVLPADFLSIPATQVQVEKVDFRLTQLPEYAGYYTVVLDNVLTATECNQLIHAAEATAKAGWEPAMINVGGGRQELALDTRNCGRIIWDNSEIIGKIWDRVKDHVPELQSLPDSPIILGRNPFNRHETWHMTRLNERMRFLKYGSGQYFDGNFPLSFSHPLVLVGSSTFIAHCDGAYETPDRTERSYFTLHLYLNESDPDGPHGEMKGGSTEFHSMNMKRSYKVKPKIGRVLIFQHRGLLHSGEEVVSGTKLTLRTDIMYRKV